MQAPFRLIVGRLITGAIACLAPAAVQAEKNPAVKQEQGAKRNDSKAGTTARVKPKQKEPAAKSPAKSPLARRPTPRRSREEIRHAARYDAAIAKVRDHALAKADAGRIRAAIKAVDAGSPSKAKALRAEVGDPAGAKLIDWYTYRSGYGTAKEIRAFVAANPTWPDPRTLTQRAEEALFESDASPAEVKAFFADTPPATAVGLAALAHALAAEKDEKAAKALAAKLWVKYNVPAEYEAEILKRIKPLLTEDDHKRRLDRLLLSGSRWRSVRRRQAATIRRTIALLSAREKKKARARLAVFLRKKNSHRLISKLPAKALAEDWGLAVQRAQALRRRNKDAQAWKILLDEPEPTLEVRPDGWWDERRANAYEALSAGKPKTAYALVRDPGRLSINAHNDACFLAGWLALRHLDDPKRALPHFQALVKSADGPLTRSRGNYWLGRTYEALGNRSKANEHYLTASLEIATFHGQLARLELNPKATSLQIDPPVAPTKEEQARFNGLDTVHAAVIAHKAGLDHSMVRAFLSQLRRHMRTEAEVAMLAHLAEELGHTQIAVRVGKYGVAKGFNLIYYAYPVHRLPAYKPLRRPPETAIILGIARQESEFRTSIVSGAGARGILQVMPGTARYICRQYRIKCSTSRLLKDASFNTMLGSAYLADRIDQFDGSYILAIAGYNAGPGRTRQWIREFGDPRDPKIDPIDWIHRIPIKETRLYVQKVLSNIQIYRARLGEEETAVRLNADLGRVAASSPSQGAAAASVID